MAVMVEREPHHPFQVRLLPMPVAVAVDVVFRVLLELEALVVAVLDQQPIAQLMEQQIPVAVVEVRVVEQAPAVQVVQVLSSLVMLERNEELAAQ
jgi:hypothetical protein